MGLFGDIDIDTIADDPFKIPDDWYRCLIVKSERKPTKATADLPEDEKKYQFVITYTIQEGMNSGQDLFDRFSIPNVADPENPTDAEKKSFSYIKRRLISLGVPPAIQNSEEIHDYLPGIECMVKTKMGDPDYPPKVVQVKLTDEQTDNNADRDSDGLNEFAGM